MTECKGHNNLGSFYTVKVFVKECRQCSSNPPEESHGHLSVPSLEFTRAISKAIDSAWNRGEKKCRHYPYPVTACKACDLEVSQEKEELKHICIGTKCCPQSKDDFITKTIEEYHKFLANFPEEGLHMPRTPQEVDAFLTEKLAEAIAIRNGDNGKYRPKDGIV